MSRAYDRAAVPRDLAWAGPRTLAAADRALRAPLPLSRRVGLVAVDGGAGTSATAAHIATTYAVRTDLRPAVEDRRLAEGRAQARTTADAVRGLTRTPQGLHLLDLRDAGFVAPDLATWSAAVGPSGRFFEVVVTDFGVRRIGEDLIEAASTCHVIAVVGRADRVPAGRAAATAEHLATRPGAPAVVLVLVDVGRTPDRCVPGLAAELDLPVVPVRHDRARSEPPGRRRLARGTRLDLVAVGAALLGHAASRPASAAQAGPEVAA